MNETVINEAALSEEQAVRLKKKGIKRTTDSVKELNGRSAIINMSKIVYKNDSSYIESLVKYCDSIRSYQQKLIAVPVSAWYRINRERMEEAHNPIGAICRYIKQTPSEFRVKFKGITFIFYNANKQSFALVADEYKASEYRTVLQLLNDLVDVSDEVALPVSDIRPRGGSSKSPVKDIVKTKPKEDDIEEKKAELVDAVTTAAENSEDEEEAWKQLEEDEMVAKLLAELEEDDSNTPTFNAARTSRMAKINDEFMEKSMRGKKIKDILTITPTNVELPSKHLKVDSINEEWTDMKFINFQENYDINADIVRMLYSLSTKTYPISIIDIKIEDTSTNMDYIDTYTVQTEDGFGKRATLTFDIPKFKNNRFMRLRGNEKIMSGQLMLLPCLKTDEDTVQCVSNYNKIFVRRHGLKGRSYPSSDVLNKALHKFTNLYKGNKDIKIWFGDNTAICSKHELPADYIDLASEVNRIETKTSIYYFNQDEYYQNFKVDQNLGLPYAVNKADNSIRYFDGEGENKLISMQILKELMADSGEFEEICRTIKPASRLNYSEASLMANKIPLVVVMGYSIGLTGLFKYCKGAKLDDKKDYDPNKYGLIKFSDGYLVYPITYSNSMLLNGLATCPTEMYSIMDVDKRSMWLDFLDEFGGRILSDGLDNFVDCFIDPITEEVCNDCSIPSDYFGMLMYANNLLADNKYNRHTDISGNRYRTIEIVAGYFYKALSKAYTDYKVQVKRGRKVGISMKRSAVIDLVMEDPMSSDLSILNPLLEREAANSVSFKGLSGMNSDRSYGLDKRTYDDSMINKLALSTGFAANVGINRQTTIDMDIVGTRGYIKPTKKEEMSVTKSFGMTEAVTPFGTTRDDPFRSAMTFIQTSKHSMRTVKSAPLLITNGADEAMTHMASETFVVKAKGPGRVVEVEPDQYMIVEYRTPKMTPEGNTYTNEYIDLRENVKKNSDGGFYITLKLDTDLKVDSIVKEGDILAYDKSSFSNKLGESDNPAYNIGVLAKVAIMNTDEGFEDSTSISSWLSEAMATDVVVEKDIDISKNTNVYNIVKVGQEVQEGDPLIVFQNSFDEDDANALLKSITDPEYVSDLGRIRLKSKYTGVIQDIKIYRTCELEEMSDSLKSIVIPYEKEIKARKKKFQQYGAPGENLLEPDYKMQASGPMKNNQDGVKIVFYIKYNDKMSVGDKCVAQSANKGVVKNIFPEGQAPFSEYRPEEDIHALFAARSFNARMVTSVWTSGAINKVMIELDRQVKEIMGIKPKSLEEIQ